MIILFEALGASFGATLAGCLVLVGTTSAAIYFFLKRDSKQADFGQLQRIVYEEIKDVCELTLVRKKFTSHVSIDTDKKIPLINVSMPGTARKFFMDYSGTIVCGFDLSEVKILRDGNFGNKIKIILPPSKILDAYADVHSFKIRMQDAGIFAANIKIEEQNERVAADVETQRSIAIREGLLIRADEDARQLLRQRIVNKGLNQNFDVNIITAGNGHNSTPPTNLLR